MIQNVQSVHPNSTFTEDRAEAVLEHLGTRGISLATAARLAGLPPSTVRNWQKTGNERGEGPLYEFSCSVNAILGASIKAAEERVYKDAPLQWLSRVDKEHWSERHEHTGAEGEPLRPLIIEMPDEEATLPVLSEKGQAIKNRLANGSS